MPAFDSKPMTLLMDDAARRASRPGFVKERSPSESSGTLSHENSYTDGTLSHKDSDETSLHEGNKDSDETSFHEGLIGLHPVSKTPS